MFETCVTCKIINCEYRVNDGIKGCIHYYNPNINLLQGIMWLNIHGDSLCKAVPTSSYSEVKAHEEWCLDRTVEWLKGYKSEILKLPITDNNSVVYRDAALDLIEKLLSSIYRKKDKEFKW